MSILSSSCFYSSITSQCDWKFKMWALSIEALLTCIVFYDLSFSIMISADDFFKQGTMENFMSEAS